MKRISLGLALMTFVMAGGLATAAHAAEFLVKYKTAPTPAMITALGEAQAKYLDYHAEGRLVKVEIAGAQTASSLAHIFRQSEVEYIVPNFKLHRLLHSAELNIAGLQQQWAITKVQAEKAWQRAGNKGSRNVIVGVIDTGADYKHQSLAPNMIQGYNFKDKNDDPMDKTGAQNPGHGTHCSGIIGATGQIDGGTIGLSPEVSIMPLRFLDENGSGDLMDGIKAIDYAISKHVNVISASWGAAVPRSQAQPLIEAVDRAGKAGIPFVVAAANDGKNNDVADYYPTNAGTDNTISVAATGATDIKPSWSNYGQGNVHVSSPGEKILSTLPNNKYGLLSGTSMATPLVAGMVAFVKAQDPGLTPLQIRSLLQASGDQIDIQVACNCRVNALTAADMVIGKKMFISPDAATIAKGSTLNFEAVYGQAPFTFVSSNPQIASIASNGTLTGVSEGFVTVSIKDARGQTAQSHKIFVGSSSSKNPSNPSNPGDPGLPDPGNPSPGQPGDCPFGNPQICEIICQQAPDLPFCKH